MKTFSVQAKFESSSSVVVTTSAIAKATVGGTFTSVFLYLSWVGCLLLIVLYIDCSLLNTLW